MKATGHRPETIDRMRRAAELWQQLSSAGSSGTYAAVARAMGVTPRTVRIWLKQWDRLPLRRSASLRMPTE